MKTVLRWIVLVWTVLTIPYTLGGEDFATIFFALIYVGLVIGLMIDDLKEK
jgi:hypothetical protein